LLTRQQQEDLENNLLKELEGSGHNRREQKDLKKTVVRYLGHYMVKTKGKNRE
jgi:hypothetical protein